MSKLLFMGSLLKLLDEGLVFKKVCAILLRIVAVFTAVGSVLLWITNWREISRLTRYYYYRGLIPAGIASQILLGVFLYCVVHTLWLRAKEVELLEQTGYTITFIFSIGLKLTGELLALSFSFLGLAGGISLWVAGRDVLRLLIGYSPHLGLNGGFIGGLIAIFSGLLSAFVSLVFFYYLAELSKVLVDIASRMPAKTNGTSETVISE